jgi:hypothetical protein
MTSRNVRLEPSSSTKIPAMTHTLKLLTSVLAFSAVILILSVTMLAQSLPIQPCPSDALDATFQAADGPDHGYTLAINLRNISGEPCSVDTHPGGSGVPYKAPDGSTVKICWYRYYCEEGAQEPTTGRIALAPGESVHQTRSWRTTPTDDAAQCVSPPEMRWDDKGQYIGFGEYWLSSRSLLKPICSPMTITNYVSGHFLSETAAGVLTGSRLPVIHWANHEDTPKSREQIPLSVTVEDPAHLVSLDEHSCPRLFVRVRDATPSRVVFSRSTRVVEVGTVSCKVEFGGESGRRFALGFDAGPAFGQADENKGEYAVDVSSLAEYSGQHLLVGATNALHMTVVNGRFMRRNWGSQVEGAAVSLNLDSDVYTVGDDILLHIALENVGAHTAIAAMDPYYDPPGVAVELEASDGQPIPPPRFTTAWTGHGFCHHFLPGIVFPVELKLSQMGFQPNRPGVYKVVATWNPSKDNCGLGASRGASYLTVKSPTVTFRIVAPSITASPEPKQ